jgi:hypothetical protein
MKKARLPFFLLLGRALPGFLGAEIGSETRILGEVGVSDVMVTGTLDDDGTGVWDDKGTEGTDGIETGELLAGSWMQVLSWLTLSA